MTPEQVQLVKTSFAQVLPIAGAAGDTFYERLFAIAPDVKPMFRNDIETQGQKLMMMIATVVADLDRLERIVPAAEALARRHVGYGALDAHYPVVGEALLWTLEAKLGDRFTPAVKDAWAQAYGTLSGCMLAATRQAA